MTRPFSCMLGLTLLTAAPTLRAKPAPRFVPLAGLEVGQTGERLAVKLDGNEQHEDRWLANTRIVAGVATRLLTIGTLRTRADTTVGFGVVYHTGHGHLDLRQAALVELPLFGDLVAPVGLSAGVVLDTASSSRSAVELQLPVGIRFRSVELLYRPGYSLPLGSEERRVLSGTRELSARPGLVPLDLSLRFHLQGLGF